MTDHQRGIDMSNAMIEAACSATILGEDEQGRPVHLSPEEARTALTAAISAYLATTEPGKPESGVLAVKVKPLNWAPYSAGMFFAPCIVGEYLVHPRGHWWLKGENTQEAGSIDEAKAAAQADYEQRIMSALSTPPQPVFADRHNDETGECEMVDAEPEMVAALRRKVAERKTYAVVAWQGKLTDGSWKTLDDGVASEILSGHLSTEIRPLYTSPISLGVDIETLQRRVEELEAALQNMMGVYDTPLSRRRFPPDEFMKEAIETARPALIPEKKDG
jgi:hypothetical protein